MLAGGVNEKFLPDSQKLIYIASAKVDPKKGSLGSQVVLNKFNEADGHGIIATSKDITEIKDSAFEKSDKLLEVILPEGLMSIGQYAFQNCRGLSSIRIPISISDIKEYAFYNIAYNTSVYISDLSAWCKINFEHGANPLSTGKLYLNNEEITELVIPSDITQIKSYTFESCSSLINVILHDQVTTIGIYAFNGCKNLTSINIPNGVTSIGNEAFSYCSSLTSITIPNSVTSINFGAFSDCTNLKSVHISDLSAWCNIKFNAGSGSNPLSQGGKLYLNNEEITKLVIPSDITKVKDYTFSGYAELIEVTLHDNIESIGDHSFSGCTNLTSITIPDSVKRIYNYAFSGCTNLTSITIPDSVVSLQEGVFYNCGFNSFIFPKSIRYVNSRLFEECKNLIKITFPSNITIIYDKAFYHCTSLGVCDFSAQTSVPSVSGYNTFTSVPNTCKFVVPDHLYDEWITSYRWDGYADQIIKKSD